MATARLASLFWIPALIISLLSMVSWLGHAPSWTVIPAHFIVVVLVTAALHQDRKRRPERALADLAWVLNAVLPCVGCFFAAAIYFTSKYGRQHKPHFVPMLVESMKLDSQMTSSMTRSWLLDQFEKVGLASLYRGSEVNPLIDLSNMSAVADQRRALLSLRHTRNISEIRLLKKALLSPNSDVRNLANLILAAIDREIQMEISRALKRLQDNPLNAAIRQQAIQDSLILSTTGLVYGAVRDTYLKRALILAREGVEHEPKNSQFWYQKGRIHLGLNQLDEAEESFLNAVKIHPQDPRFPAWLAELSYLRGDWTATRNYSRRAIGLGFKSTAISESLKYWGENA